MKVKLVTSPTSQTCTDRSNPLNKFDDISVQDRFHLYKENADHTTSALLSTQLMYQEEIFCPSADGFKVFDVVFVELYFFSGYLVCYSPPNPQNECGLLVIQWSYSEQPQASAM